MVEIPWLENKLKREKEARISELKGQITFYQEKMEQTKLVSIKLGCKQKMEELQTELDDLEKMGG
jgi:hypothetical protein